MASTPRSGRAHEHAAHDLGPRPLLPLSGEPRLRRAGRARRLHAARPRRAPARGSPSRTTSRGSRSRSSLPGPSPPSSPSASATSTAGSLGATLVGLAFILPSFLMMLALGAIYVAYGGLAWMQAAFYGVGAGGDRHHRALAPGSSLRLSLAADRLLWAIVGVMALVTVWTETEIGSALHPVRRRGAAGAGAAAPPAGLGRLEQEPARAGLAPVPDGRPDRHRDAGRAGPDPLVLHEGRRLRVRQRPGDRALPLRRRRAGVPLAHRPAVPRRGRGRHDHAGAGGDHGGLHRLSRRRPGGRRPRRRSASSCPPTCSSWCPTAGSIASARTRR